MANAITPARLPRSPYGAGRPPLAGLGLPLATSYREGIPDTAYLGALARVLVPPQLDVGLDLRMPEGGGHVCDVAHLLSAASCLAGESPAWSFAAWRVTRQQIAALIPTLALPAARGWFWVFREHFDLAIRRLGRGDIEPRLLPAAAPPAAREPLAPPAPRPAGPVLASHLAAFFGDDYHRAALRVASALSWVRGGPEPCTEAGAANAAAERLLGVPVDLRAGRLVTAQEIRFAIRLAVGGNGSWGDAENRRCLTEHVLRTAPPVRRCACRLALPEGGAWSCAVDAALNGPPAWLRRADARPAAA